MQKRFKKIVLILITGIILGMTLIQAPLAYSQAGTRPPIVPKEIPEKERLLIPTIPEGEGSGVFALLPAITQTVIGITGAAAILFIIIGAIQILTAYGNDERITAGKKTITFAIVGLLVAILAYAIVSIISAVQLETPQGTQTEGEAGPEGGTPGPGGGAPGSSP